MPVDVSGIADQWLPVGQAAVALGISERTLRRHLSSGSYQTRHVAGRLEVLIPVPAMPDRLDGAMADAPDDDRQVSGEEAGQSPDILVQALSTLERVLTEERIRANQERERASVAEQAAAMWQERARNLEAELQHVLALPAHEEVPESKHG